MDSESLKEFLTKFYRDVANQYKKAIEELEVSDPKSAQMLLGCKYSVFYSNPFTTLEEGPIYTLGLNPGGTPTDETIFQLEDMTFFQNNPNWSEYLSEKWKSKNGQYGPGEAPLQGRVREVLGFILKEIGREPKIEKTFATNLYFFRSPDGKMLQKYGRGNYDCWKYHERFLEIIRPKIIVCIGNSRSFSPFSELANRYKINLPSTNIKPLYGTFWLKSFFLERPSWDREKVLVLGLPHFSRFEPGKLDDDKYEFYRIIREKISQL